MALLAIQKVTLAGLAPTYAAAAAGGDTVPNDGRTMLHVKSTHTAAQTVTVDSKKKCNQNVDHDPIVSVPGPGERIIGPFSKDEFDDVNQQLTITYSGVTLLTIAAIQLPEYGR